MTDDAAENAWGAGVWEQASLVTPMAIRVAATLRIADHVANGRTTARELAEASGSDRDALGRMLRHLVTVGLLTEDADGYRLTRRGEVLREDHPDGIRPWLDLTGAVGRADLSFVELAHTIRTGQPAYPVRNGVGFWDGLAADERLSASFNALMSAHIARALDAIRDGYDWASVDRVVDVGGGDGSLLIGLLTRHPRMRGTVVDLPGPARSARARLAEAGLADRADAVSGSYFDALPPGADVYVLSAIVHDCDDEDARRILTRCADAAGQRGRVFVIESVGGDGESPNTEMDLRMLAYTAGKERGLSEYAAIAADAGLSVAAVHPAGDRSIIELAMS